MTDTITEFGGVKADAPLFREAPADDLQRIVDNLSSASYHYADDSAKEWKVARQKMREAAEIINRHRLPFYAIKCLHRHTSQLVSLDDVVDAALAHARGI